VEEMPTACISQVVIESGATASCLKVNKRQKKDLHIKIMLEVIYSIRQYSQTHYNV